MGPTVPGGGADPIPGADWPGTDRERPDPVRDRFAAILGAPLWKRLTVQWDAALCRELARIADALDELGRWVDRGVDALTREVTSSGSPQVLREAVGAIVRHAAAGGGLRPQDTAKSLRVLGVCVCSLRGLDIGRCACFIALTRDVGKDKATEMLREITSTAA